MKHFVDLNKVFVLILVFLSLNITAQNYNKKVQAVIEIQNDEDFVSITGFTQNKQDVYQELRYELSVFKTSASGNKSKNNQAGRFVLDGNQKKQLSQTTINIDKNARVIALLLIYDLNDKIIGKDRVELNGKENRITIKKDIIKKLTNTNQNKQTDLSQSKEDGVEITGLVVEETKTKPGRDFYTIFNNLYNLNNLNGSQVVTIKEILALGRNTQLQVIVGGHLVHQFFMRPDKEYLTKMGDVSLIKVYRYFKSLKKMKEYVEQY